VSYAPLQPVCVSQTFLIAHPRYAIYQKIPTDAQMAFMARYTSGQMHAQCLPVERGSAQNRQKFREATGFPA